MEKESLVDQLRSAVVVQRWMASAYRWANADTIRLQKLSKTTHLFSRIEQPDQVLLLAVKFEEIGSMFDALLMSMPPACREQMMQAFMRCAQRLAEEAMAGVTPEERAKLHKEGTEIALAMLDKAMNPGSSRPQ